ncbi:Protein of unknown function [Bacillus wiedmannii]|nr:Protein of unknown function [Bacillus wiedmannii]
MNGMANVFIGSGF